MLPPIVIQIDFLSTLVSTLKNRENPDTQLK